MSSNVQTLINSGFDSFTNLYSFNLQFPTNVTGLLNTPSLATQDARILDFVPPELSINKNKYSYKEVDLEMAGSLIKGERQLNLKFRIDSNYSVYSDLMTWKHYWANPNGFTSSDTSAIYYPTTAVNKDGDYGSISIYAINSGQANPTAGVGKKWAYYHLIPIKIGTPQYSRENPNSITVDTMFIFANYAETDANITA